MSGAETIVEILQRKLGRAEKLMDNIRDDHERYHADSTDGEELKDCAWIVCNLVGEYDQAIKEGR